MDYLYKIFIYTLSVLTLYLLQHEIEKTVLIAFYSGFMHLLIIEWEM